ncbi:hypothetical protein MRX96_001510 [Rhipicephalus microplus]
MSGKRECIRRSEHSAVAESLPQQQASGGTGEDSSFTTSLPETPSMRSRDLHAQVRDEQREKIALEKRRLQAEECVLLLKLKVREQKTGSNAGEIGRPERQKARSYVDHAMDSKNMADFVGVRTAYKAFSALPERKRTRTLASTNITSKHLFFIAHCVKWCAEQNAPEP